MRLENPKKPVYVREILSKRELENPEEPVYIKKTLSRLGMDIIPIAKASTLVTLINNSNFHNLYTPYITSK